MIKKRKNKTSDLLAHLCNLVSLFYKLCEQSDKVLKLAVLGVHVHV